VERFSFGPSFGPIPREVPRGRPPPRRWDTDIPIPIVTVAKVLKRQSLDFHPTLFWETQAAFGREPLGDTWPNEDAVLFSIQRKPTDPKHKKILDFSGGCKLDDRTLRILAEEIDVAAEVLPFWDSDSSAFVVGIKRFILTPFCTWVPFLKSTSPKRSSGLSPKRRAGGNRR
jgi:hypothetical protein